MPRKMKVTQGAGRGWENHAVDPSCRVQRGDAATVPVRASFSPSPQSSLPPRALAFGHTQDRFASHIRLVGLGWGFLARCTKPKKKKRFHCTYWSSTLHCNASHRQQLPGNMYRRRGQSKKKKKQRTKIYLRPAEITVALTACQRHTAPSDPWVDCRDETRSRLRLRQTSDAVARATPCLHFNLPAMSASPTGQSVQSFHARDQSVQS